MHDKENPQAFFSLQARKMGETPPPAQRSVGLLEHPALWSPGWVCVLQSRAGQRTEHKQGLFL